jgi:hypothetical protein
MQVYILLINIFIHKIYSYKYSLELPLVEIVDTHYPEYVNYYSRTPEYSEY